MKRMTIRTNEASISFECESVGDIVRRLAAIEDILGDEYDLNLVQRLIQAYKEGRYIIMKEPERAGVSRLRELAQADREGRCVVLPCKVGDEIYQPTRNFISTFRVRYIEIFACGNLFINTSLEDGIVFNGLGFPESELGKTVFLTRSEAEEALRREQE